MLCPVCSFSGCIENHIVIRKCQSICKTWTQIQLGVLITACAAIQHIWQERNKVLLLFLASSGYTCTHSQTDTLWHLDVHGQCNHIGNMMCMGHAIAAHRSYIARTQRSVERMHAKGEWIYELAIRRKSTAGQNHSILERSTRRQQ